jgi:polysaccharide deacetylase 2 family uncharacterized protein YibQ
MPKAKTSKKKHSTRKPKQRRPRLGIYLLAGICAVLIMWGLIRDPEPAPQILEQIVQKEIKQRSIRAQKAEKKQPAEKESRITKIANEQKSDPDKAEPEDSSEPIFTVPPAPKPQKGETQLDLVIRGAAEKLGVPSSATRRSKQENLVSYRVPIDRSQMDLTYANMIIKGELERAGAELVKGTDSRSKQTLLFKKKDIGESYEVSLFYDSKLYQGKLSNRTITIVIDDFGAIVGKLLDGFFELDKEICFAIFPDEENSVSTMQRATRQGRNSIIHVPMEPIGYPRVNPGNNAILVQHSEDKIDKTLSQFIARMPECLGINNHMGSLATADPDIMQAVMNTLKRHNKLFLDSRTTNVSVAYQTAQKSHIKAFQNDIFLDSPNISSATMESKISRVIQLADSRHHVIAITHCHNQEKLDYLIEFVKRIKQVGFTLVPLSKIGERDIPEIL